MSIFCKPLRHLYFWHSNERGQVHTTTSVTENIQPFYVTRKICLLISNFTSLVRHAASRKFLGAQGQVTEGQNFFVYSDENEEIKCLYWYYTRILVITSRPDRYFMNS